ncbi:MAG: F0F1 ATP synthase subunit A [Peptostreptococcaceae bacterium]|nr:F0F1 ATP synthase subunit A [Peptostreptococcaceae bacterium]
MHDLSNLGPRIILGFGDGGIFVTETVFFAIIIAITMSFLAFWMTHNMQRQPKGKQVVAEFIVQGIYKLVEDTMGKHNSNFAPYIGTLFIFLLFANSLGLLGFRPVTADVNTAFALSLTTAFLIQYHGFRTMGFIGKIKHMSSPYPFMFPLKVIEELSFPISLGFRLFGNILGGAIVMALLFTSLETASEALHLPIPLLQAVIPLPGNIFFDIFEPILQAFIFTMLTMVFISMEIFIIGDEHDH